MRLVCLYALGDAGAKRQTRHGERMKKWWRWFQRVILRRRPHTAPALPARDKSAPPDSIYPLW